LANKKKPKPTPTPKTSTKVVKPSAMDKLLGSNVVWAGGGLIGLVLLVVLVKKFLQPKRRQSACTPCPYPAELDGFKVGELIANGGTATVYRGADPEGNPVAIKIPHVEQIGYKDFVATFLREGEIGLSLRHPSIVKVMHVGSYHDASVGKVPFFVMEQLEGEEVDAILAREHYLDPAFAIMIARSVADALQWAHSRGVIHRDISPMNIFVTNKRLVKVMDFGISTVSKKFSGKKANKALNFGTPSYLAPERILNKSTGDERSDLYALGCVIFEMVVGIPPYDDERPEVICNMHVSAPIPRMGDRSKFLISRDFESFMTKILAKRPEDRYQTAREVVSALVELMPDD
jgi:eukaryotic-like serine/threonine-protein kinase